MTGLSDSFQRPINYLRISVTDRCNLRCIYCMPPNGISLMPRAELLSYEEICLVAQAAVELGITKLRLTGGEPLVRASLVSLIGMLAEIPGIDDLALTTNGVLLGRYATELKEAGLHRVNVSLDSLRPQRFEQITRCGQLDDVLAGIEAAVSSGLSPVKINMVVMQGVNEDEVLNFAAKTTQEGWHVRFIELMLFGQKLEGNSRFVSVPEMMERVSSLGHLVPCLPGVGNGPAKYFRLPGADGTIGFIGPITQHSCISCNRLRLTADGRLRPCLLSDAEIDLRGPLRRGASKAQVKGLIEEAVASKPQGYQPGDMISLGKRPMRQIGG